MTEPRSLADLPGPRGLPFLGNALQINPGRLHRILEAWAGKYGSRYKLRIGPKPIVVLGEPEEVLSVLRDRPETFRRLGAIEAVIGELGMAGVFSAEGETWRRHRELVMQGFDRTQLRRFFPTLAEIAGRLVRRWAPAARSGEPFDGHADLTRYTVDVTTNFVFGCDLNTLERGADVLQAHIEKILPTINRRINAPVPYWRFWKFRGDREVDRAMAAVQEACAGFIAENRARLAAPPPAGALSGTENADASQASNLLEGFLSVGDGGTGLSEAEIIGNTITMLIAGEDTSAHTLAWIIDYLCHEPEVQRRVREEVDGLPEVPTSQDLDRLAYLDGVMQEAMRLKSVAPLLFLEANRDTVVGGLPIPRGTGIMALLRYPCLEERHFTRAAEFHPERWLLPRDLAAYPAHHKQALIPFGAGPRFCPGRHLAWIEIKAAMAALCRHYHLAAAEGVAPARERFGFTMMPSHLRIRIGTRG